MKRLKCMGVILMFSIGCLSAQTKAVKQMDVFISSQMTMQMTGSSNVNFEIPVNADKLIIEKEDAIQIKIQTNHNWVLNVKPLSGNLNSFTNKSKIPSKALRIRANGNSFTNLDPNGIDLIKGNKGSYQSAGNNISIDYELPYEQDQSSGSYQVTLLFTLAAI